MTGFAIVSTTIATAGDAETLANALVEGGLAACVQIVPITSVYRWQGKVEKAAEHLMLCKIAVSRFEEVSAAIIARHPYDVPEIVMTSIDAAGAAYRRWLAAES